MEACCVRGGLIPACAGKTSRNVTAKFARRAHPRVCGENRHRLISAIPRRGSSPRVRGKRTGRPRARRLIRLIPACAGKTGGHVGCGDIAGAHPRVCGENSQPTTRRKSPRWLIPACAGKTPNRKGPGRENRAHPRVCGENPGMPVTEYMTGAHPRVCGENLPGWEDSRGARGSSPRVRGKPAQADEHTIRRRLIPACAGKTCTARLWASRWWAHPRVCGENWVGGPNNFMRGGSSPRVRGKPPYPTRHTSPCGLIPACAGKTGR